MHVLFDFVLLFYHQVELLRFCGQVTCTCTCMLSLLGGTIGCHLDNIPKIAALLSS